ncbi:MAG TPA: PBP1A family penicillin-binding protein [Candidatus Acidoferrales bacterium]|nr:PBP1A family penicillin-binding protein [Candidatus Acidoferrales bacterium]
MKKPRLSRLKIIAALSIFSALVLVGLAFFMAWYVKELEGEVTKKFEGQKWKFPSKIYSDTYLLYPGINVDARELQEKLRRLGYRLAQGTKSKGEYRVAKNGAFIDVHLHDFDYPGGRFEGFPVRIEFRGGAIERMANLASGEELFSLELEPELIAGLYDRIWEERRVVRLSEVPPLLVKAILAVEDERFFRHRGIDPVAILRAAWVNLTSRGIVQGGSTLTQQLMKNFFLGDERTVQRKLKEALMALIAERKYSKEEILENYLNEIYLGQKGAQGIFGVSEAAQFYFGKELRDLTVGEMALTAGLIRAPNRYSPYRSVEAATQRRNVVLAKMRDLGLITRAQYEKSLRETIQPRELIKVANDAPSFVDFLRKELAENYSHEALTAEGLRIFTSLDLKLQKIAESSLAQGLKRLEEAYPFLRKRGAEDRLDGAIVVIKPQTGEIKAMAGGRDYQASQFNRVVQAKRQPGSVFKPFVYLAALMYGSEDGSKRFTPATLVEDAPFVWSYEGQEWKPDNYRGEYFGTVTLRTALEKSLNAATIRIARETGVRNVREVAYRLGIQSSLPALPSLALGAVEVTPLEVAAAFSTLANNGVRTQLLSIKHVMGQQAHVLERRDIRVRKVISPQLAFMMNHLLKGVLDRGTAAAARAQGFTRPAAGKTGTTNDTKDAWFVGYTPDLLAVVWVGFDNQSKLGLSGSQAALPIWTDFMKRATEGTPVTDFVAPPGISFVDIDPLSGQRATPNCPQAIQEAFLEGEEPTATCQLHPAGGWLEKKLFPFSSLPTFRG